MKKLYKLKILLLPCIWLVIYQIGFGQDLTIKELVDASKKESAFSFLGSGKAEDIRSFPSKGSATVEAVQEESITGQVVDESGESLPGVTVVLKGTTIGTATDLDGNFSLEVPEGNGILVFSFIGYQTQEVTINNRSVINIVLIMDIQALDEVVVVGYGVQKRANLTGSVATVSSEVLTRRPAPNAANLIQGRVPGLQVTQPSAEPGRDNPNFLIRGRGSFGGSNNPLILIDGVTGSFNNLSPDDIESVTVLKDAASASIYGARAANGVILVTTKKGSQNAPTFSYRLNVGRHSPTALPDLITNSAEYMEMYNIAAERSGIAFRYPEEEIGKYRNATDRDQYPNFDNIDYYINPATVTNHSLGVSGGGESSTYNLSLSYLNQDAMLPGYNFKRYNALLNYSVELSKVVTVGTSMNLTYKDRQEPPFTGEGMALSIYAAGPLYGPFLPDGSGRVVSRAYQLEGRNRNVQEYYVMGNQRTEEYNLNGQAYIDIRPFTGLTWSTKAAINYVDEFYKMHQTPYEAFVLQERDPETNDYKMFTFGPDVLGVTDQYSKSITPTVYSTLTYETRISDLHDLRILAGYEQLSHSFQNLRARRINTAAPILTDLTGYTADNQSLYFSHPRLPGLSGPSEWALQSIFGRINYSFKDKYLLETNVRYDGTSRVSPGYRWGAFPSMSAGWLVSEEPFLDGQLDWITVMKLRASYGTLGNQDINNYAYQDIINLNVYYPFGNEALQQGGVINELRDKSLIWESTSIVDLGFDLNLFEGKLDVIFDWYRKTTNDILARQPVPASLGLSSPILNDGKMKNTGIELEVSHRNRIGEISYGANALFSTAKNELLHISVPGRGTTITEVGLPYGSHFLYEWDGIFQIDDIENPEIPEHVLNPSPKPGDLKMKDQNGDGVVDPEDRIVVDGAYPDYIYSFGFDVGYKGFTLNAFFQGVQGLKARVTNWGVDPFMQGTAPGTKWRDAWTPENPTNTLPAIYVAGYQGVAAYTGSTYYLQDASYLRLKNILLSYSFPVAFASSIRAKGLSVYVSADNLFTWTDYEGGDPERASISGNFSQYPQARIFNAGINVQF